MGRPRVQRIRGTFEQNANKKKVSCKRCKGFGNFGKKCKPTQVGEDGEAATTTRNKRYMHRFSAYSVSNVSFFSM
jgi:hypothetical protein